MGVLLDARLVVKAKRMEKGPFCDKQLTEFVSFFNFMRKQKDEVEKEIAHGDLLCICKSLPGMHGKSMDDFKKTRRTESLTGAPISSSSLSVKLLSTSELRLLKRINLQIEIFAIVFNQSILR